MQLPLTLAVAFSTLVAATPAFAGTYLEEQSTISLAGMPPQTATIKTWVEGDKVRSDDPRSNLVTLLDLRKRTIVGVTPSQKTWWKLPDSAIAEFGAATLMAYGIRRGADGKVTVPPNVFQKTGKKKTIKVRIPAGKGNDKELDVSVEEVKVNLNLGAANPQLKDFKSNLWVGNVPGYDPAIQRNRTLMFIGNGPEADAFLKQWDSLGGAPLITEQVIPAPQGTVTMTTQLLKVAPMTLRPSDLQIPKTFKQVEDPLTKLKREMPQGMPGMPTPQGNAPAPMQ